MPCQATLRKSLHGETFDLRITCHRYMYMYACVYVAASFMHAICPAHSPPSHRCHQRSRPLPSSQARTTKQTIDPEPLIDLEYSIHPHKPSNNVSRISIMPTSLPTQQAAQPSRAASQPCGAQSNVHPSNTTPARQRYCTRSADVSRTMHVGLYCSRLVLASQWKKSEQAPRKGQKSGDFVNNTFQQRSAAYIHMYMYIYYTTLHDNYMTRQ